MTLVEAMIMQRLRRTQLVFDDIEDLTAIIIEVIVEAMDIFGELDGRDPDVVDLIEDLTDLEVWEVVEIFKGLLEANEDMFLFEFEALTRWEVVDPDFHERVVDCLDDE